VKEIHKCKVVSFSPENFKGREYLGDQGIDKKIILK
jgi:hypothetical protein